MQVSTDGAAQQHHERRLWKLRDLAHRPDSCVVEPAGRDSPDAPEPLHGKRVQELELTFGRHGEESVRLGDRARDLGQELRPRDADGDRQPDLSADVSPQPLRDLGGTAGEASHSAHVEERLVDREPFDERGRVLEDLVDGLARLGVGRHARPDDDRIRAESKGSPDPHRRVHAPRLRLVARGQDDPAADEHGPAAKLRVVALFDRREERVEVGVEDRGLGAHEHMFA
jgi:hypothetical protein